MNVPYHQGLIGDRRRRSVWRSVDGCVSAAAVCRPGDWRSTQRRCRALLRVVTVPPPALQGGIGSLGRPRVLRWGLWIWVRNCAPASNGRACDLSRVLPSLGLETVLAIASCSGAWTPWSSHFAGASCSTAKSSHNGVTIDRYALRVADAAVAYTDSAPANLRRVSKARENRWRSAHPPTTT